MYTEAERRYLDATPLGYLGTTSPTGHPHVVPVCFTRLNDRIVSPIDEKPQRVSATDLQRVTNIQTNPHTMLLAAHYTDNWADLGWVQVRGNATISMPDDDGHAAAVTGLRAKYAQYESHNLEARPIITITPRRVNSWGTLDHPTD